MKTPILTAALLALLAAPALAGDHRGEPRGAMILKRMDADGDGAVTRAEADAFAAARFAEMDANGDGGVSTEEALAFRAQQTLPERERRARVFVAERDADNDGMLSAEEMSDGRMTRLFDRLDANDDGQIDAEEMKRARKMRDHKDWRRNGRHGDGPWSRDR